MTTTESYRITERSNDTDSVVRVVAVLTDKTFLEAVAVEKECIPSSAGTYIRLERAIENDDTDDLAWEYL
jgi:hypothetical protein